MAQIALIFFLFALFAVCMCAPVNIVLIKETVSRLSSVESGNKAMAAVQEGLVVFQKLADTLKEQIQKSAQP